MSLRIIIIKLLRFGGGIEAAVPPAGVVISTTGVVPQTQLRSLERRTGIAKRTQRHPARALWISGPATLLGDSRIFIIEPTRADDLGLEANTYMRGMKSAAPSSYGTKKNSLEQVKVSSIFC